MTYITSFPIRTRLFTEKTKLAGIAANATANDTDENLRDRATHTGEQAISTVTGLQDELDSKADLTTAQTLNNKTLHFVGSYTASVQAIPAFELDCGTGTFFTKTIDGAITFTFANVPTGAYAMTLEVTHHSGTIDWPASVVWPGGTEPTLETDKTHLFYFVTRDGGTRWRGAAHADYVS